MADTFTALLRLVLQETGGNQNVWGDVNNASAIDLLEDAIAARLDLDVTPAIDPVTLTADNGAADQSRNAIIALTGNPGGTRDIIVPSTSKVYIISNETSPGFDMTIKTAAGSGLVVSAGTRVAAVVDPVADDVFVIGDIPTASETVAGVLEIATQVETDAGALDDKIITPLKLNARAASETLTGILELATQVETDAGTDDARAITPAKFEGRKASETLSGHIELATQVEVDAGTDTERAVTPDTLANRPAVGSGRLGAKAFNNTAQSISDSTETSVAFAAESYDTDSIHDLVVNNSRLTVPAGFTKIRLTGYVSWTPNGSSFRLLLIRKNGSSGAIDDDGGLTYQPQIFASAANATVPDLGMFIDSGIITVAENDFFDLRVFHNAGIALFMLDEQCWFQMELIEA